MKKLILMFLIAALPCAASFAQTSEIKLADDQEKKCVELSRELANSLLLNELEYIKLKSLTREKLSKEEEALRAHKSSPEAYDSRLQEIEAEFEAKLLEFLSPTQKKAFALHKQQLNADYLVITTEE